VRISESTLARYGAPGDPIPGSAYVRDYCAVCGDPIRVAPRSKLGLKECDDCRGLIPAKVLSQQRARRCEYGPALRAGGHR